MTSRRAAGEAIPATSAVPAAEKTPSKAPERAAVHLGVEDLEAVEEDAGGDTRVAHVQDASARSPPRGARRGRRPPRGEARRRRSSPRPRGPRSRRPGRGGPRRRRRRSRPGGRRRAGRSRARRGRGRRGRRAWSCSRRSRGTPTATGPRCRGRRGRRGGWSRRRRTHARKRPPIRPRWRFRAPSVLRPSPARGRRPSPPRRTWRKRSRPRGRRAGCRARRWGPGAGRGRGCHPERVPAVTSGPVRSESLGMTLVVRRSEARSRGRERPGKSASKATECRPFWDVARKA